MDITLAQDMQGVTVTTKTEIKTVFYEEFRQRFEASRKPVKCAPSLKSRPGECRFFNYEYVNSVFMVVIVVF